LRPVSATIRILWWIQVFHCGPACFDPSAICFRFVGGTTAIDAGRQCDTLTCPGGGNSPNTFESTVLRGACFSIQLVVIAMDLALD